MLNGINIVLDVLFVVVFDWGVHGVALATVAAEVSVFVVGSAVIINRNRRNLKGWHTGALFEASKMKRMFVVNRDIMIRTLCLIFAFAWFTDQGAAQGM